MAIDLKYQSVSEAFKILEAKIDAIMTKLDDFEEQMAKSDNKEEEQS